MRRIKPEGTERHFKKTNKFVFDVFQHSNDA